MEVKTSVLVILFLILIYVLLPEQIKNKIISKKGSSKKTKGKTKTVITDLNEKFLMNAEKNTIVRFLRTFNPNEQMIIRLLLDKGKINSYVEFSNVNSLFPGITITGYTDSIVSIYEKDIMKAKKIVLNYITVMKSGDKKKTRNMLISIGEFAVTGYVVPSGQNRPLPEFLL